MYSTGEEGSVEERERLARAALPLLEASGEHGRLLYVWIALAEVANVRCRFEDMSRAAERAIVHARALGVDRGTFGLALALVWGPRPALEALETLDALLPEQPDAWSVAYRAVLLAMLDRSEEAWAVATGASERLRELSNVPPPVWLAPIAEIAGDHGLAADKYGAHCDWLETLGAQSSLSTYAAKQGREFVALGRYDDAEQLAKKGRELGAADDTVTQMFWRQVQARVLAHRGEHAEARRLAREAVAIADDTDMLWGQGDAYSDLAEVLEAAGEQEEAIAAWRDALDRYERKQIIPLARRVRERLAALQATPI
jgi:tetratricopeptide (TPR) repeat protein